MASRFIPTFLEEADTILEEWRNGEQFDMVHGGLQLLVKIMCRLIFGQSFLEEFPELEIEVEDGKTRMMNFFEAYDYIVLQSEQSWFCPTNVLLPFFGIEWNIGFENRKIIRNHWKMWDALRVYLQTPGNVEQDSPIDKILRNS